MQKDRLFCFDDVITFESRKAQIWDNGFTMLIRCTDKFEGWVEKLLPKLRQDQSVIVFSMWGEYINTQSRHAKSDYLQMVEKFNNLKKIHTSGHASMECLAKVCTMTNPKDAIIPIHSDESNNFKNLNIAQKFKDRITTNSIQTGKTGTITI